MIIKTKTTIASSEITDQQIFLQRRKVVKALLGAPLAYAGIHSGLAAGQTAPSNALAAHYQADSTITPANLVKNYNNYYEFSLTKEQPATLAQSLRIDPWTIEITGEVERPLRLDLDDVLKLQTVQEYVYRFRCVEAWSMVVPWLGFPLASLLKTVKPLSSAQFVKFTSVDQPEAMPLQANNTMLEWPYVEGLRIDEALHPLTLLATGLYGEPLSKQNGAPIRLVVPWKYGFKSIKAVVKIELLKKAPLTTWNKFAPRDYGFYANVNPNVPHPRWSQASERPLGSHFFTPRRKTELFNGYGEQVAALYRTMDLSHFF